MGNRKVLEADVCGITFNGAVFDGEGEAVAGEVALYVRTAFRRDGSSAEVRTYCRARDLRNVAAALLDAARVVEMEFGA